MLSTVPRTQKALERHVEFSGELDRRQHHLERKQHKGGVGKGLKVTSAAGGKEQAGAVAREVPKQKTGAQSLNPSTNEQSSIFPSTPHPLKPQVFFQLFFLTLMFQFVWKKF